MNEPSESVTFTTLLIEINSDEILFTETKNETSYYVRDSEPDSNSTSGKVLVPVGVPVESQSIVRFPDNVTVSTERGMPFFHDGFLRRLLDLPKVIQHMIFVLVPKYCWRLELFSLTYPPTFQEHKYAVTDHVLSCYTSHDENAGKSSGRHHGCDDAEHDLMYYGQNFEEPVPYIENSDKMDMHRMPFECSLSTVQRRCISYARWYHMEYVMEYDSIIRNDNSVDYDSEEDYYMNYDPRDEESNRCRA